ncbi:hypothetical protein [Pseudoxanthomonas winnipegensis]|uniref:Secreted protein n=1 Tax=Pseudoxanthomonas winnipegensis TaxID=2480810 RepID=A0A4Q8M1W9_9GAMM|nr:hypothetical protein [Pseudoxanthomonas winnipegensis]TAA40123.1 hypothetical protein EA655_13270 [Pseudoxanthomonas winnipegensis]
MKNLAILLSLFSLIYSRSASSGDFERAFEAGKVAARSFESKLAEERGKVKVDKENVELVDYVYDDRNYAIGLARSSSAYVVIFSLKRNVRGSVIMGGGARYEIDADTLGVKSVEFYE